MTLVPYHMASPDLEELMKELKKLLDVGYIRPSLKNTIWYSYVFLKEAQWIIMDVYRLSSTQ